MNKLAALMMNSQLEKGKINEMTDKQIKQLM